MTVSPVSTLADLAPAASAALLDVALKATLILLVAAVLALVLRRTSAALRSLLWSATFGALLALPLLLATLPAWRSPLVPDVGWRSATGPTESSIATTVVAARAPARAVRPAHAAPAGEVPTVPLSSERAIPVELCAARALGRGRPPRARLVRRGTAPGLDAHPQGAPRRRSGTRCARRVPRGACRTPPAGVGARLHRDEHPAHLGPRSRRPPAA